MMWPLRCAGCGIPAGFFCQRCRKNFCTEAGCKNPGQEHDCHKPGLVSETREVEHGNVL